MKMLLDSLKLSSEEASVVEDDSTQPSSLTVIVYGKSLPMGTEPINKWQGHPVKVICTGGKLRLQL